MDNHSDGLPYLDKNTLKVYGSFWYLDHLRFQFGNTVLNPRIDFKLNELTNFKMDKTESYPGDTITLSWDGALDKRDVWNLKVSGANSQIVEQTEKFIKIKLPKYGGWNIDFAYNYQVFSKRISDKSPFNDITKEGGVKSGDKIIIKTNYPIDANDVYSAYFLDNNAIPNQSCKYDLKYIDSRTL